MTALTPIRTKAETALMAQFDALRGELSKGDAGRKPRARPRWPPSRRAGCRIAGSRPITTPTCAISCARRHRSRHQPSAKAGRSVEAGRFLGDLGAHEIIIVNGRLMDAVEPRLAIAHRASRSRRRADTAPTILDRERCRGRAEHGPCARNRHARDRQGRRDRAALACRLRPGCGRAAGGVRAALRACRGGSLGHASRDP